MFTVEAASTLPMACNCTGMERDVTVATVTGAAGACCGLAACTESLPVHPSKTESTASAPVLKISFDMLLPFSFCCGHDGHSRRSHERIAFLPARWPSMLPQLLQD